MVEKMVIWLVGTMLHEQIIENEEKEEYIYSLTVLTEGFITIGSIMILSIVWKNSVSTAGFLLFFLTLRKRTGGYHAPTFHRCYYMTLATYCLVVYLCQNLTFWQEYHWLGVVVSSIIILIIGTVNHPNVQMNQFELENAKESARCMLMLEVGILFFLKWMQANSVIVIYLSTAVTLCGTLLCLAKLMGQEVKMNESEKSSS